MLTKYMLVGTVWVEEIAMVNSKKTTKEICFNEEQRLTITSFSCADIT